MMKSFFQGSASVMLASLTMFGCATTEESRAEPENIASASEALWCDDGCERALGNCISGAQQEELTMEQDCWYAFGWTCEFAEPGQDLGACDNYSTCLSDAMAYEQEAENQCWSDASWCKGWCSQCESLCDLDYQPCINNADANASAQEMYCEDTYVGVCNAGDDSACHNLLDCLHNVDANKETQEDECVNVHVNCLYNCGT